MGIAFEYAATAISTVLEAARVTVEPELWVNEPLETTIWSLNGLTNHTVTFVSLVSVDELATPRLIDHAVVVGLLMAST